MPDIVPEVPESALKEAFLRGKRAGINSVLKLIDDHTHDLRETNEIRYNALNALIIKMKDLFE